jgi:hypothetical protein
MRARRIVSILFAIIILSLAQGIPTPAEGRDQNEIKLEEQRVLEWRRERNAFLKDHGRSPLLPQDKKDFKGIKCYPFDAQYFFSGQIERTVLHINNPKYYATFLTNKGTSKRYIRYGKFHFTLNGRDYTIEIYKSILSDNLFIPFKDKTNGRETYEGGRYVEAEILPGYKIILDFNTAYNPSCAYNDKFVCVIPPKENILDIEIRAGEKNFK